MSVNKLESYVQQLLAFVCNLPFLHAPVSVDAPRNGLGWTCPSHALLPGVVPEIDANPMSFYGSRSVTFKV